MGEAGRRQAARHRLRGSTYIILTEYTYVLFGHIYVRILYVMISKYMSLKHIYVIKHIYVSETYTASETYLWLIFRSVAKYLQCNTAVNV